MFEQNRPSGYALAMLALISLVIVSQVDAGLWDEFRRDRSYERFANELYNKSPSSELKDNVNAAVALYQKSGYDKRGKGYRDLLYAFVQDTTKDEQLCNEASLQDLLRLADAMAAQGNLGLEKITPAISRINLIIIQQIIRARAVCSKLMVNEWPQPWRIPEEYERSYWLLKMVDEVPRSLLLDSEPNLKAKVLEDVDPAVRFCCVVESVEVSKLLQRYVLLLIASDIIDPKSNKMAQFYKTLEEPIVLAEVDRNDELLENAYRFRACKLLHAMIRADNR